MNITFNIPVKIDSSDRLDNLKILVKYLQKFFPDQIINVCENDATPTLNGLLDNVNYLFFENKTHCVQKTKTLNHLCRNTKTDIFMNVDVDAIFHPDQIHEAYNMIKNGIDMVYPYSGLFFNVPKHFVDQFVLTDYDFSFFNKENTQWWSGSSVGAGMMWNKKSYQDSGMENENFVGWGFEDDERYRRSLILGLKVGRSNGPVYHMDHQRISDNYKDQNQTRQNQNEFNKINSMNREQLSHLIKTWSWLNV